MTPIPRDEDLVTPSATEPGVLRLELHGYLDHGNAERFLTDTTTQLLDEPDIRVLRVDCTGLAGLDSTGLSALLMLHRRTTAANVCLHLENRPPVLDRMLTRTGMLDHLVPDHRSADQQPRAQRMAYRRTPDEDISIGHGNDTAAGPDPGV
ncbi:STAS domain-containing protein [Streptomyces sp. NPDC057806]|uniref:STAS domain-containing protein n=1 Tax=Streptomyces sp. NPDC057806 TaxID=3346255 RepID=UPI003686AF0D